MQPVFTNAFAQKFVKDQMCQQKRCAFPPFFLTDHSLVTNLFSFNRCRYPVQFNWTNNLKYIAREKIGIEFMEPGRKEILDHWAFGPHHVWSLPATGEIHRMWQPFNGLEIFPQGTSNQTADPDLFKDIPPALCKKKGGATMRIKCDDNGFPVVKSKGESIQERDMKRAKTKRPRDAYRGDDFFDMSNTLNRWMENGKHTAGKMKSCKAFTAQELQKLQAFLYLLRHADFDGVYQNTNDNRRLRKDIDELMLDWNQTRGYLKSLSSDDGNDKSLLESIHRDGHCHEALMWFVHHLTEDVKAALADIPDLALPLLSPTSHIAQCDAIKSKSKAHARVCGAYEEQVTCASCHSNAVPGHNF